MLEVIFGKRYPMLGNQKPRPANLISARKGVDNMSHEGQLGSGAKGAAASPQADGLIFHIKERSSCVAPAGPTALSIVVRQTFASSTQTWKL